MNYSHFFYAPSTSNPIALQSNRAVSQIYYGRGHLGNISEKFESHWPKGLGGVEF